MQVLNYCTTPRSANEIMLILRLKHKTHFKNKLLNPLLERGYLERTIPEKPKSRFQKYIVTAKGLKRLSDLKM